MWLEDVAFEVAGNLACEYHNTIYGKVSKYRVHLELVEGVGGG